jgi:hypothetical protein
MCAVIKQGILGGGSGRIGNVIMSSWKGKAVIKSAPLSVANPNTVLQQAQRNEMKGVVASARILLAALIQVYWNPFAQQMSGYNYFVKENIATFTAGLFTDFATFFSMRGSLLNAILGAIAASAAGSTLTLNWTDNTGESDALGTDEAVITYYNETQGYWVVNAGNATRAAGTIIIADAKLVLADVVHVYLGMSRPNISKVSDSSYDNVVVGA